jgi:hypothetical protein
MIAAVPAWPRRPARSRMPRDEKCWIGVRKPAMRLGKLRHRLCGRSHQRQSAHLMRCMMPVTLCVRAWYGLATMPHRSRIECPQDCYSHHLTVGSQGFRSQEISMAIWMRNWKHIRDALHSSALLAFVAVGTCLIAAGASYAQSSGRP